MKTTRILSLAMTMAMGMIAGLHASVTEHQPPAPLPEFKTPEQLAKWRADQSQKTQSSAPTQDGGVFYTGKPYLAESGSYAFKYREYNPEMGRWTTVDPSGFPDGANNRIYVTEPTACIDNNGLKRTLVYGGSVTADITIQNQWFTYTMVVTTVQSTENAGASATISGTNSSANVNAGISVTKKYEWQLTETSPVSTGHPQTFPDNPPPAPSNAKSASFWIGNAQITDDPQNQIIGDTTTTTAGATYVRKWSDVWTKYANWGYYE
jgi:RHS repeat-associated protein